MRWLALPFLWASTVLAQGMCIPPMDNCAPRSFTCGSTFTTTSTTTSTSSTSTSSTSTTSTSSLTTTIPSTTSTSVSTTTSTSHSTTTSTSSSSTSTTTTSSTSTTSSTAVGATTSTSTSTTSTTSTSHSTTSSTSTSSTTSTTVTTSTTSTSTSTSTTTSSTTSTTTQAPSWAGDSALILYLRAEETAPSSTNLADQSPATNPLSAGSCSVAMSDTTHFWDGARGVINTADTCLFPCDAGNGCTDANFAFTSGDFSCGFYARPTAPTTGTNANVLGTALTHAPDGWALGENLVTGKWDFYIAMGFTGVSVSSSTNATDGTDAVVGARYDATSDFMDLYVNGQNEDTDTQSSPGSGADGFNFLGEGDSSNHALGGTFDHIYCFNRALTDQSRCRIEVCGIDGSLCTCSGATYITKPKHSGSGGPINCTLPNCNTASPSFLH